MSDLTDLYQEVILDHYRNPHNFREMADADRSAEGYNPLCGDRLTVYLRMDGDTVSEVTFQGTGCAISQASASVMTDAVKGKTPDQLKELFTRFRSLVTEEGEADADLEAFGELAAMSGVRAFPTRVKCATLGWHTLLAALEQKRKVSTE
jgi:nitrogen fixation NifU-like protein